MQHAKNFPRIARDNQFFQIWLVCLYRIRYIFAVVKGFNWIDDNESIVSRESLYNQVYYSLVSVARLDKNSLDSKEYDTWITVEMI